MNRRQVQVFSGVFFLLLFSPRYALATWFQWGTEGSYVHQMAHLLFAAAMIYLMREMYRDNLQRYRGFRLLMWACGILALWNLDAVVGHTLEWGMMDQLVFLGQGLAKRLLMENLEVWFYYLTKIDHFALLIPAFYLFYRGLQALAREAQSGP